MIVTLILFELCTTQDYMLNAIYWNAQGAITLVLTGVAQNKIPGAQLHMMVNITVKFHDCDSYTFGLTCDTKLHAELIILKCTRGHNSGLNRSGRKQNPGAQLHMMANIPVKFHVFDSYSCGLTCDTRFHAKCITLIQKCIRGHNSGPKQNPRCTTTHDGKRTCKVSWVWLLHFYSYARHTFRTDGRTYWMMTDKGQTYMPPSFRVN
jgi:hypothetical protein